MLQSPSSLVLELQGAKSELHEFFKTRNDAAEPENGKNGNVQRFEKGAKVQPSNREYADGRPPREKPSWSSSPSSSAVV
jgi:hypothetical protein